MAGFDYSTEAELFPARTRKSRFGTGGFRRRRTPSDLRSRS